MQTITVERVIAAPLEAVFSWVANQDNYIHAPMVFRQRLVRPGVHGGYSAGAEHVRWLAIGWFRESVTAIDPPHTIDYAVDRSFPPSRHESGRLTFTAVPAGTHVHWTTTAQIRIPLIGDAATRIVGRPLTTALFSQVLAAADRALT